MTEGSMYGALLDLRRCITERLLENPETCF